MNPWLILPRDPLIFRDGRPFNATPGERANSLAFPFPSTTAGAIRTMVGTDSSGVFDVKRIDDFLQINVRGPILVEFTEDDEIANWYFSAPADALLVEDDARQNGKAFRYQLMPISKSDEYASNIENLNLIGPAKQIKGKSLTSPKYWVWDAVKEWLEDPKDGIVKLETLGIPDLERDVRTHVSISPETKMAIPGALFLTSGLDFMQSQTIEENRIGLGKIRQLGLALETDADMEEGIGFLGGERRIVQWKASSNSLPSISREIVDAILEQKHCRMILATPAFFRDGHLPAWLKSVFSVQVDVLAAAVPRYQTISGWDYEHRSPKPTRRLAPAGSTYFLKLDGSKEDVKCFIDKIWMNCICDDEQLRRDGFGLALLGIWDGKTKDMDFAL